MRKIYSTLTLSFIALALFSQDGPLLQKFKYRIDHYRAIGYGINGAGNYNQLDLLSGVRTNNSTSASIGANYYAIKSTDRILMTTTAGLFSAYNRIKSVNTSDDDRTRSLTLLPSVSVLNKWFTNNKFTELGAVVSSNFNLNKDVRTAQAGPQKNNRTGYALGVNLGIGTGRLENITDMQNALWLYKELNEAKITARELSGDELLELGRAITKGNNTRVLDARRRTQFILKTVDSYFQQQQLITKTDIDYFMRLNDILFFAVNNPRFSGTEKYIRLTPAVSGGTMDVNQYNIIDKYEQRYDTRSVILSTGISKYRPVNLAHQENYGIAAKLAYISKKSTERYLTSGVVTDETHRHSDLKQAGVKGFFEHAVYPNTRTIITVNLQSEGGYQDLSNESNFYGNVGLAGIFNYFISYRTRLNCSAGISYQKNMYYDDIIYFDALPNQLQLTAALGLEINL
ncbi:MAG: hypothetical protein ABIQ31_26785 [Ferruginibacter sp.]